jgi:hypothetical protein
VAHRNFDQRKNTMNIKIPYAETIEKGIASLPTNVAQSLKIRDLTKQLLLAEKKIAKLEAEVAELRPVSGLAVEAGRVLQQFGEQGCELNAHQIADITGIKIGKGIHHFTNLRSLGFIQVARARSSNLEPPYRITPKGSSFLVEQGML